MKPDKNGILAIMKLNKMQYNLAMYHTVNIHYIGYINQYISYILKTKCTQFTN